MAGYLMQLMATHRDPTLCHRKIAKSAKNITVEVALFLALLLLRPIIYRPNMEAFNLLRALSLAQTA